MKSYSRKLNMTFDTDDKHSPLAQMMDDEIKKMVDWHRDRLAYCLYTDEPLEPRQEVGRFRRWLGWKVHGLAARLNPDVVSY